MNTGNAASNEAMKPDHPDSLAINVCLAALIVLSISYTAMGAYRDYQDIQIESRVISSLRSTFQAKSIVDHNHSARMSNLCDNMQRIPSRNTEISCQAGRIMTRIAMPGTLRPIVIVLSRRPGSGEWQCQASENTKYIPTACRPHRI